VLSVVYVLLLGLMMMIGNQSVTPGFFWLTTMIVAASLVVVVASRVWKTAAPVGWKLQRISGGFLLLMVPAHMLFMHLNTSTGHEAAVVIARMQNAFIKFVDLALVIGAVFHGGYGLISISKDYIDSRALQKLVSLIIILVMVVFGWAGVKLTIAI